MANGEQNSNPPSGLQHSASQRSGLGCMIAVALAFIAALAAIACLLHRELARRDAADSGPGPATPAGEVAAPAAPPPEEGRLLKDKIGGLDWQPEPTPPEQNPEQKQRQELTPQDAVELLEELTGRKLTAVPDGPLPFPVDAPPPRTTPTKNEPAAAPRAPAGPVTPGTQPTSVADTTFHDRLDYFSLRLPAGYRAYQNTSSTRSSATFSYHKPKVQIELHAWAEDEVWNGDRRLLRDLAGTRRGRFYRPRDMSQTSSAGTHIDGAPAHAYGYAGVIAGEQRWIQRYALVKGRLRMTVQVECRGADARALFHKVCGAVRNSLRATYLATRKPGIGATPVTPVPARSEARPAGWQPSDEDWAAARKAVIVEGVMKRKGVNVAFVNGRIVKQGDTLTVNHAGYVYRFRVQSIGRREVELAPAADAE